MMHRTKVFAEDSREAMAKITKELGHDAVILSTRKVSGGIEIIAGHRTPLGGEEEAAVATPAPLGEAPPAPAAASAPARIAELDGRRDHFARLLAENRDAYRNPLLQPRPQPKFGLPPKPAPEPKATPVPQRPASVPSMEFDEKRFRALEKSVGEIKSMLSSELMLGGLKSLVPAFLAQAGTVQPEDSDTRFAEFLAMRMLHKRPPILTDGPRVVVTLGPSGAGKTTLLAQLAARLRMRLPDEKIAFVNADTNRLGAAEQLRAHGRILDVPVIDVEHPSQLTNLAQSAGNRLSMFIDMPSNPDECSELLAVLEERADKLAPMVRCGVVAANLSAESIDATLDRYPHVDALALTKLDEARITMTALSRLGARGPGIAWLAHNPHLVRGLSEPDHQMLRDLILATLPGAASDRLN